MAFLLPARPDGLAAVEKGLTAAGLEKWLGAGEFREVTVALPLFDVLARHDLRDALAKMGMAGPFVPAPEAPRERKEARAEARAKPSSGGDKPEADAERAKSKLVPSAVLQQVYVHVTVEDDRDAPERPPEAAGASRIALDRAFLFIVRDRRTQEVVLIGRVANPRLD
jgi:serine protease inhibitor